MVHAEVFHPQPRVAEHHVLARPVRGVVAGCARVVEDQRPGVHHLARRLRPRSRPQHRKRDRRRRIERAHLHQRVAVRQEQIARARAATVGVVVDAGRVGAHALQEQEQHVARTGGLRCEMRHRQRVAQLGAELVRLIGVAELGADQAADGVQVQHVGRARLQLAVLRGDEESGHEHQWRHDRHGPRRPPPRPEPASRHPQERKRAEERRQVRPQVGPDIGEKLVEDAVHQVGREHRHVHVEVGVVLLEEVLLATERERDAKHEQRRRHPAEATRAARSCVQQRGPDQNALEHRGGVGEPIVPAELVQPGPATQTVECHRGDGRQEQERPPQVATAARHAPERRHVGDHAGSRSLGGVVALELSCVLQSAAILARFAERAWARHGRATRARPPDPTGPGTAGIRSGNRATTARRVRLGAEAGASSRRCDFPM